MNSRKKRLRFDGGEIVRLRHDQPEKDLLSGDCGLVWGVYDLESPLFEASFINKEGTLTDMMFHEEDVEELTDSSRAPFIDGLEELRRLLNNLEAKLRKETGSTQGIE